MNCGFDLKEKCKFELLIFILQLYIHIYLRRKLQGNSRLIDTILLFFNVDILENICFLN